MIRFLIALGFISLLVTWAYSYENPPAQNHFVEWELIIRYKQKQNNLIKSYSYTSKQYNNIEKFDNYELVKVNTWISMNDVIQSLKTNPDIEHVQPNYIYYPLENQIPNDPLFWNLWGLNNTGQTLYWTSWNSWSDISWNEAFDIYNWNIENLSWVIIAIIDDWIAYNHPDLENSMWDWSNCLDENWDELWNCIYWYDYWENDKNPSPEKDHWTHIAWTIAATLNNGIGTVWVAPYAKLIALKSRLFTSEIVKAINFSKHNWAKVINASFWLWSSWSCASIADKNTYDAMNEFPWLIVIAAWNDTKYQGLDHFFRYPANYAFDTDCWDGLDNLIIVWATDQNDNLASFSDYWHVDIWAPWVNIYSTMNNYSLIYQEDFSSYEWDNLTWFIQTWTWANWGIYNWDLFCDLDTPYLENADTFLTHSWLDLSWIWDAYFELNSYCDTQTSTWWTDYMSLYFMTWSDLTLIEQWDESKSLSNTSSTDEWDFVSYDFQFIIDSKFLKNSFQYVFEWTSSEDDNNYNWCSIASIKIYSYNDNSYEYYWYLDWTSMATPHVAWLAWLIYSLRPYYTANQVKDHILESWDDIASLSWKILSWKRINAHKAIWKLADPSINNIYAYTDTWKIVWISNWDYLMSLSWAYFEWDKPTSQWTISGYIIEYLFNWTKSWSYYQSSSWYSLIESWAILKEWKHELSVNWENEFWASWKTINVFSLFIDKTAVEAKIISNNATWSWKNSFTFSLQTSDTSFWSSWVTWSNNSSWSTQTWSTYTITNINTWNLIVYVQIIDFAWNESNFTGSSYMIDSESPNISFSQIWESSTFTWSFSDNISWINSWSIAWYYSIWSTWSWITIPSASETWASIPENIRYSDTTYLKITANDNAWNSTELISEKISFEWDSSIWNWLELNFQVLPSNFELNINENNNSTIWAILGSNDTIESIFEISVSESSSIPISSSMASKNKPYIVELLNTLTWLYEIQDTITDNQSYNVKISGSQKLIIRSTLASWSTTISWSTSLAIIASQSWSITTSTGSFKLIWSWSSVDFWTWVSVLSWYSWIILPPVKFSIVPWSSLDNDQKPSSVISVWANWKTINFTWWKVTLTIDLWEACTQSAKIKYWNTNAWQDYSSVVTNKSCDQNNLLFDVSHFSIYGWDSWACTLSQVQCWATCGSSTYKIKTWEVCSDGYIWTTCNLWACASSGWGGGGGGSSWWWSSWWWSSGWWFQGSAVSPISNYVLSTYNKKDIEITDNLDLKKISNWIIPVSVKLKHLTSNYYIKIEKWSKITNDSWLIFNWIINAPLKISIKDIPKFTSWITALRALEIWSKKDNINFSKPIKLIISIKWLSSNINKSNLQIFSYNNKTKQYVIEDDSRLIDKINEQISVNIDHLSTFVLAYVEKPIKAKITIVPFWDIYNHWASNYINTLYRQWVFANKPYFLPNDNLNRAELVKIVIEAFWFWINENLNNLRFNDVNKNTWYAKYILTAQEKWIITWDKWKNTFRPWESVNRAEAMKIVLEASWVNIINRTSNFSDVYRSAWYYSYVNFAAEKWIVSWYWNWLFKPWKSVTRGEIAKIVFNVLEIRK